MPHRELPDCCAARSESSSAQPLVFLSTLSAVDAYVLRAVSDAHPHVHLVHLLDEADPNRPPRWRRVLAHPWRSVKGRLRESLQAPGHHRMERRIARALFGEGGVPEPEQLGAHAVTEAPAWHVRHASLRERITAIAPSRMLVCGAPWLPNDLCRIPEHGTFNIHWGIAPEYRGGNSIFFALREGRSDCIGVTLHEITPRIDAGAIVAQGRVDVDAADDETSLWVKCAHEAAALTAGLARLPADQPVATRPQGAGGHNYRYAERTARRELALALRQLLGRRPTPHPGAREPARLQDEAALRA